MSFWYAPYVSMAERKKEAALTVAKMLKKGQKVSPIRIDGRTIAKTFWGKAWCDHLESFSDFENRLPRGRTYVRNGSVIHLSIGQGIIEALVQGSSLYKIKIEIKSVDHKKWLQIIERCSGQIDSVVELLQGRLSSSVMKTITDRENGLFPHPNEISLDCSCPDWATMCKHVSAVLYGVGARLDKEPELLFKLRHVDHLDLVTKANIKTATRTDTASKKISDQDLSTLFGIDVATTSESGLPPRTTSPKKLTPKTKSKIKANAKTTKIRKKSKRPTSVISKTKKVSSSKKLRSSKK